METLRMQLDPIRITLLVTEVLEKLGVQYVIGGSLASTLHGMVRTTQDSDIVADLERNHISFFVQTLLEQFFIDDQMIAEAIDHRSSFNIIHRESMFKVDVFIPQQRLFDRMRLTRARREILARDPDALALVSTAEDTLLAKLEWFRMGGEVSERQWRDVLGVIGVQAEALDFEYLRRMAKELGVDDLLDRALTGDSPK
jgi:hypothetical protein